MIAKLNRLEPSLKALTFCLYPLVYYWLDILNYSQAGKAGVLGFFTLATFFYWRELVPRRRLLTVLLSLSLVLIAANVAFEASVRDIFGMQQDDVVVIQSIFSTNTDEATEFFIQYGRYIGLHTAVVLVFCLLYWRLFIRDSNDPQSRRGQKSPVRLVFVTAVVTFLLVALHFNPAMRRGNPLYYFPHYYLIWQRDLAQARDFQKTLAATTEDKDLMSMHLVPGVGKRTVVFVIGESDTRNDWSLYGYSRDTNPELSRLQDGLLIFRDSYSGDGSTIGSVTKMLTPATMTSPDLWKTKPNIVTMAKKLGYKVIWVTNQGNENRGIVSVMASLADEVVFVNKGSSRSEGSFDGAVLGPYDQALADPAEKKFIVVHILGDHPAYNFRYPENYARFEDVYDDQVARDLKAKGRATWAISFRNMYDSAVLYEDHVLAQLLSHLESSVTPAAWVYVSDHGQDVAHNSNFSGHNRSVRQMWEVPLLVWASADFDASPVDPKKLIQRPYQADVIDHTLLGLLGARGYYYQPQLDLLSANYDPERFSNRHTSIKQKR